MPPKYDKSIAIKRKNKPSQERGESSNAPSAEQTPALRKFSRLETERLLRRFSVVETNWLIHHNNDKVSDFVDRILASEARVDAKNNNPNNNSEDPSQQQCQEKHSQEEPDSESEDMVSIRYCHQCDSYGCKKDMVKCRKYGYWHHTLCVDEPIREGPEDPTFSFWLCPKCRPDPKLYPGYKFTYRTKAEIEADKHYKDTDSDEAP